MIEVFYLGKEILTLGIIIQHKTKRHTIRITKSLKVIWHPKTKKKKKKKKILI